MPFAKHKFSILTLSRAMIHFWPHSFNLWVAYWYEKFNGKFFLLLTTWRIAVTYSQGFVCKSWYHFTISAFNEICPWKDEKHVHFLKLFKSKTHIHIFFWISFKWTVTFIPSFYIPFYLIKNTRRNIQIYSTKIYLHWNGHLLLLFTIIKNI